jgi:hypothetical protein
MTHRYPLWILFLVLLPVTALQAQESNEELAAKDSGFAAPLPGGVARRGADDDAAESILGSDLVYAITVISH